MFSYIYTNAWKSIVELLKLFYVARIYISESNAVTVGFDCCSPVEKIKKLRAFRRHYVVKKTIIKNDEENNKRMTNERHEPYF